MPSFEPPAARAAAEAVGWGAAPGPRTGAPLGERRTVVVATDLISVDRVAFREAEALRLPNV